MNSSRRSGSKGGFGVNDEEFVKILKNDLDSTLEWIESVASEEQLEELKDYLVERTAEW